MYFLTIFLKSDLAEAVLFAQSIQNFSRGLRPTGYDKMITHLSNVLKLFWRRTSISLLPMPDNDVAELQFSFLQTFEVLFLGLAHNSTFTVSELFVKRT